MRRESSKKRGRVNIDANLKQLLLLGAIIGIFRLFYVDVCSGLVERFGFVLSSFVLEIFRNVPLILMMIVANLFFARYVSQTMVGNRKPLLRILVIFIYLIVVSAIASLVVNFSKVVDSSINSELLWGTLKLSFMAAILINSVLTIIPLIVIYYIRSSKHAISLERSKKEKARFQYDQLKRQLDPHFLFNSLNMLDCLVYTDPDRASMYINKLAGIYRYMLGQEKQPYVTLKEELNFADMYVDLLKERFAEGFEVRKEIAESYYEHSVIPCSLQVLIENAVKHNIVSPESQLVIEMYVEEGQLVVKNNLQPKLSKKRGTGTGLKNIDGQYRDVFGKGIYVKEGEESFEVGIPLISSAKEVERKLRGILSR